MNILNLFFMWFPSCAGFVALAVIAERAWKVQRARTSQKLLNRVRMLPEDTRPLLFLDDPTLPWKRHSWKYGEPLEQSDYLTVEIRRAA